ncbi:MAG: PQQ-binding-like beta-propeller repeat protein, partial [Phycisphaeraceae bacterium]|nr:PQQ-binding-like beta-propeller repeat protein [Phycisphaeraceae bacterium]
HGDWLEWRGPHQNGVSDEKNLPSKWQIDGENHLWTYDLKGRGTPVVHGNRLYAWGYRGEKGNLVEVLACLEASTGKKIWEHTFADFLSDIIYDRYAIGAPTVDGSTGKVYLMTTPGLLCCFSPDGKLLWQHSMMEQFGRNTYPNGRTGSPVISDDLVIVRGITTNWGKQGPPRDRFYAFKKDSGKPVWAATPGHGPPYLKDSCFAMPVFDRWGGKKVFYTGLGSGAVVAVDARTGDSIWRSQQIVGGINSTVVVHNGKVIATHGRENLDNADIGRMVAIQIPEPGSLNYDKGPVVLDNKKTEAWRYKISMFTSSPILVGDRVYQINETGELHCVDANTGRGLWHKKLGSDQIHASPAYGDGKIYAPMHDGSFWILKPTDTGAETLSKVQLEGVCLGAPAISHGRVFVFSTEKLYAFGRKTSPEAKLVKTSPPRSDRKPTELQIIPNEVLLRPGEKVSFRIRSLDADGVVVDDNVQNVTWAKFIPPTAKVKVKLNGDFNDRGELVADDQPVASAGAFKATGPGGITGTIRARVLPAIPFAEDFESFNPTVKHQTEPNVTFAYPPLPWIGGRFKWEIRQLGDSKVLAKTTNNKILIRAVTFIGHPDAKSYTMQADVRSDGTRRGMGEVGLINQRYMIVLKGNHQKIEVNSNQERLKVQAPFKWKARKWYTLKTRVDVAADGSGVVRAKAWPRGGKEPAAWTIEVKHQKAHTEGSPGLFGFSAQRLFRVYVDNIKITPNR